MAPVRWKDKTDIGTLADGDRMPVTDVDDGNIDKYTTPAEIGTFVGSFSVTFTNKSGNISQWTNDIGYLTTVNNGNWSGTDLAIANGGTGQSSASAAFNALKQTATESAPGVSEWSTTAEVRAAGASDDTVIRSRQLREAAALVALTDAATVALNWTAGINFTLTITANRVLGNPSNGIPGTTRTVFVISDGGPDELTFGNQYGGEPPTLDDITTTKGYLLSIYCRTATQFLVTAIDGSPA